MRLPEAEILRPEEEIVGSTKRAVRAALSIVRLARSLPESSTPPRRWVRSGFCQKDGKMTGKGHVVLDALLTGGDYGAAAALLAMEHLASGPPLSREEAVRLDTQHGCLPHKRGGRAPCAEDLCWARRRASPFFFFADLPRDLWLGHALVPMDGAALALIGAGYRVTRQWLFEADRASYVESFATLRCGDHANSWGLLVPHAEFRDAR